MAAILDLSNMAPILAPAKNQKYMTLATSGPNLVLVERFEQFRGKYGLSPLTKSLQMLYKGFVFAGHPHVIIVYWHCTVFSSITKTSLVMILVYWHYLWLCAKYYIAYCCSTSAIVCLKIAFFWYWVLYFNVMRILSMFPGPMFPSLYVPQHLCSPVPVGYLWVILISHSNPRPTTPSPRNRSINNTLDTQQQQNIFLFHWMVLGLPNISTSSNLDREGRFKFRSKSTWPICLKST